MALSHATKGKVIAVNGSMVVFRPHNSTYELHLQAAGGTYAGPVDQPIDAVIRGTARKVYTVPSGGLFVTPIMGPPRIIQGRVKDLVEGELSVSSGTILNVTLPTTKGAVEMANGAIADGTLVNVVLQPGATLELASSANAE